MAIERVAKAWARLQREESGIAMTEYIIVFASIILGMAIAILAVAGYIKAYRDFLVYWLANPLT